jgi:hypothetical protein
MELNNIIKKHLSNGSGCIGVPDWKEVIVLSELVHNNQNHLIVMRRRKPFDEIPG